MVLRDCLPASDAMDGVEVGIIANTTPATRSVKLFNFRLSLRFDFEMYLADVSAGNSV